MMIDIDLMQFDWRMGCHIILSCCRSQVYRGNYFADIPKIHITCSILFYGNTNILNLQLRAYLDIYRDEYESTVQAGRLLGLCGQMI